jgi:spectinomycin phosphotransferase
MRALPAGLTERDLVPAAAAWGLAVRRLRYVPEGGGSYHWAAETAAGGRYFLTADDLATKPWLGQEPEAAFRGLRAAFGTALGLHRRAGLPFVVPPLPTLDGETAVRIGPRYSLAVFPFVDGEPGHWGQALDRPGADRLAALLAELHLATQAVAAGAPRHDAGLPGRAVLAAALAGLDQPWHGGPFAEPVRRELAGSAATVGGWLAAFDELTARVAARGAADVVTHGEPHPGNFIEAAGGARLIDWDTVALAPPERDLWMLAGGGPGVFARYTELTGRAVDPAAIELFRLTWALADLAAFTGVLRAPHGRDADTEKAYRGLLGTLHPGTEPGPYEHVRPR